MRKVLTVGCAIAVAAVAGCVTTTGGNGSCAESNKAVLAKLDQIEALIKKMPAGGGGGVAAASKAGMLPRIGLMNDKRTTWNCVKVDKGPTIDGKLDDEVWKKAIQVKLVGDGEKIANDTAVLICHDGKNMYIGAHCMEEEMGMLKLDCTERDQKIYGDDNIEFYIDPEMDRTDAVKLVVNPNGVFMDFLRDLDGDAGDVTWNPVIKTAKNADHFIMEIAIPIKDMGLKYKAGTTIGFNPYRQRHGNGKQGEYSTWKGECNKIATIGKVTFE